MGTAGTEVANTAEPEGGAIVVVVAVAMESGER
jgi:hypothetical protein